MPSASKIGLVAMRFLAVFCVGLLLSGGLLWHAWAPAISRQSREMISKTGANNTTPQFSTLSALTYNIGYASGNLNNQGTVLTKEAIEHNLALIIEELRQANASLVFLQEVDFDSDRTFRIDQAKVIAETLDYPYMATAITWNHRYVPWPFWPIRFQFGRVVSGQVVLSKIPMVTQKIHRLPKPLSNPFWYNWFYLDRVVQEIDVEVNDQPKKIFNTHLEAFDQATRAKQFRRLAKMVNAEPEAVLFVAGDFNSATNTVFQNAASHFFQSTTPENDGLITILVKETGLQNAENKTQLTYPADKPQLKLDHIFFANFLNLSGTSIGTRLGSDHLAIWATFGNPVSDAH